MKAVAISLLVLFGASPAFALNYTGSAELDWSTFSLSGIQVTPLSESYADQGHAANLNLLTPVPAGTPAGFGTGYNLSWHTTHALVISFPDMITFPEIDHGFKLGTGSSVANGNLLTASVFMDGLGLIESQIHRSDFFRAEETGDLTVSIGYSLTHIGVPPISGAFASTATARLVFGGADDGGSTTQDVLSAPSGLSSRSGVLTLTRFFQVGEIGRYLAATNMETRSHSVPLPDTFWPLAIGMIGLAGFVTWRQRIA